MAGPNLELFKFSLYLFFPLAIMVHYGDPQWYHDNVLPLRDRFWPDEGTLYVRNMHRSDENSIHTDSFFNHNHCRNHQEIEQT